MKKALFLVSIVLLFMGCDNGDMNEPENVFAGGAWEYKSFNGDILQQYKKITFTKNEFTVYDKIDNTNTVAPGIYESTTVGTYYLFYEEIPNPHPELAPGLFPRIRFISDKPTMNGTVLFSFSVPFSVPDGSVAFWNDSGECSLITFGSPYTEYWFTKVD
jgi:hypothetical protein